MIDFDNMPMNEPRKLTRTTWDGENIQIYDRAQECTKRTGAQFNFNTLLAADGKTITGFEVVRIK